MQEDRYSKKTPRGSSTPPEDGGLEFRGFFVSTACLPGMIPKGWVPGQGILQFGSEAHYWFSSKYSKAAQLSLSSPLPVAYMPIIVPIIQPTFSGFRILPSKVQSSFRSASESP